MKEELLPEKTIRNKTFFAFIFFLLAFATGVYVWKLVRREPREQGIPTTLRKGLMFDESLFRKVYRQSRLVPTYPISWAVKKVRVNGNLGLKDNHVDSATWRLKVAKTNGDTISLSLQDIQQLPKTEIVFDFKCIEGWSQRTWWGGVRFSDFIRHFHLTQEAALSYAGLYTPDREYYVGIDMPSILQPQTLLCYEMNGKPLPLDQGYPLRLIIPVKYGIKHIKRIGTIYFSNDRPPDYWAERGYDYYSGH
ncbi:MAG: molybdopterin-dependent oxidoreductase [Flavisolibacter sp.]